MEVPSGRILEALDLRILQLFAQYGFIRWSDQPVTFRSGVKSRVIIGGREDLTDHPDLEWLVGLKIRDLVLVDARARMDSKQQCLIGIPTAGTALAQATSIVNFAWHRIYKDPQDPPRIIHRIMRQDRKTHGVHPDWVNGKPQPELHTYWMLDNTVTDGGTKVEARERLDESNYPIEEMPTLVVVDRQQGGIKRMEQAGFSTIVVAYYLLDLTFAFRELNLWPKGAVQAVEEEIKAHPLVW